MPFGFWAQMGPRNHVLDGSRCLNDRGNFGERVAHCVSTVLYCVIVKFLFTYSLSQGRYKVLATAFLRPSIRIARLSLLFYYGRPIYMADHYIFAL